MDYCSFLLCRKPSQPAVDPNEVNVTATCEELYQLWEQHQQWPATIDLCDRAEQAVYACPFLCDISTTMAEEDDKSEHHFDDESDSASSSTTMASSSCFTEDNPPLCHHPNNGDHEVAPPSRLDASDVLPVSAWLETEVMYDYYQDDVTFDMDRYELDTHLSALQAIPANSIECTLAREAYPDCYIGVPRIPRMDIVAPGCGHARSRIRCGRNGQCD
jgi:hypothetical protein